MKKTGTGYLRSFETPNLRKQDGPTERWLCCDCEQLFSTRENYFATEIFYPFVETSDFSFAYDARLLYFLISVLGRIAHRNLGDAVRHNDPFLGDIRAAEEEWRLFLLETQPLLRFAHIHLFLSDLSVESPPGVPHFNTYCTRALDGVVITDTRPRFVYAKLARFMCFGMLSPFDEHRWVGTRVNGDTGILACPQSILDTGFGGFISERAGVVKKFASGLSNIQRGVIESHVRKNSKRIAESHFGKTISTDCLTELRYASFKGKVGRNEPCPCGSGIKFKKCHGQNR
jgi:hypothetical protein